MAISGTFRGRPTGRGGDTASDAATLPPPSTPPAVAMASSPEEVGLEIRDLRKARGLTLKQLADATGLSLGHLSEVERGIASPSVKALHDIAASLGVTIGWFFRSGDTTDPGEREVIVRAGGRRTLAFSSGIVDELLSPNLRGSLELLLSRFAPGATSGDAPYTHRGEEAGVVMQGVLALWVGEREYRLREGDSFSFQSGLPHRYTNPGDTETVVIWAITPPSY
jgi:transcriptional regulator with XRE-family HTH domain